MQDATQEVKNRTDIVELVGRYASLKKAGRHYKACCPFHSENTPSFIVSPERQSWHCFGSCHEGGDAISFLMKVENLTFLEALKDLAKQAGIELKLDSAATNATNDIKDKLYALNTLATKYYHYVLTSSPVAQKARDYLQNRGINTKIIETFQLGYSPNSWSSLTDFLKKKKIHESDIVSAGLAVTGSSGKVFDRFRGRLMFPISDHRGSVIGFSGRILETSEDEAKYVNTPETPLYHKRESLYGIHLAKDAVRKEDNVILVEGEFDMISPFEHGISNIVAIKGSAVTAEQLRLLKRFTKTVTLALDADAAGVDAIKRAIPAAEELGFEIRVAVLNGAKDPDEAVRENPVEFKKSLQNTVTIYDFLIDKLTIGKNLEEPYLKKDVIDELVAILSGIGNPIVLSHYVKKLSKLLSVAEESITQAISNYSKQKPLLKKTDKVEAKTNISTAELLEKTVLSLVFQYEPFSESAQVAHELLESSDFSSATCKMLFEKLKTVGENEAFNSFAAKLPAQLTELTSEIYMTAQPELVTIADIRKIAIRIRDSSLRKQQKQLQQLQESSLQEDSNSDTLLQEIKEKFEKLNKQRKE